MRPDELKAAMVKCIPDPWDRRAWILALHEIELDILIAISREEIDDPSTLARVYFSEFVRIIYLCEGNP